MKITEQVELCDGRLIVTGTNTAGFGFDAKDVPLRDYVEIIPTEEFDRLAAECKPCEFHAHGLNAGAPSDGGLDLHIGRSGIRYLVDRGGPGMTYVYADAATVEACLPPRPAG